VINQFFTEATVIVSRYGGYVHEFVGDELIFYLKDEEHVNSVSMALSCILEIQDSTLQYQSEIKRVYQMPFTIKSSVSVGKLRYGPLVNGFSLMGPPLIESVRVLSLVDDRNKNQLFVPENVKERAFQIFGFEEKGYYLLKGYNHDRLIFELNSRRGLSRILEELRDELVPLLTCFRSPREIFHVINFLAVNGNISVSLVMRVLGVYRDVYTLGSYPEIREALVSLVRRYRGTPQAEKVTPTVIKLMQNLVAKDIYDSSMKELFTESLNVENERGIANTLEVFGHYEDLDIYELYNRFKDSGSARVIGNILVMWGKREVNKDLREIFHERLMSGNPQIVASCLYAFAEILFYWRQKDIVYIRSQIEFVELERDIRKIGKKSAYSGDEPIQRQIQRANNSLEKLAA
jgi:adenylate cyclase